MRMSMDTYWLNVICLLLGISFESTLFVFIVLLFFCFITSPAFIEIMAAVNFRKCALTHFFKKSQRKVTLGCQNKTVFVIWNQHILGLALTSRLTCIALDLDSFPLRPIGRWLPVRHFFASWPPPEEFTSFCDPGEASLIDGVFVYQGLWIALSLTPPLGPKCHGWLSHSQTLQTALPLGSWKYSYTFMMLRWQQSANI